VPQPLGGEPHGQNTESLVGLGQALLHSVYDQPGSDAVNAQFDRILDALAQKMPEVYDHLDAARGDIPAFTAFPKDIWRQNLVQHPNERLNREIRRRTDVGISPDRDSLVSLVGAVLAEQHDEWTEMRRYIGFDVLARSRAVNTPTIETLEVELTAITA
jgi:putative transposase